MATKIKASAPLDLEAMRVSGEQVLMLATSVLAFEELFDVLEGIAPSSIGDRDTGASDALTIVRETFGLAEEDGEITEPMIVELHARAREQAAKMLRAAAEWGEEDDAVPFTFHGDGSSYTPLGLREAARRLEQFAKATRDEGNAWPDNGPYHTKPRPGEVRTDRHEILDQLKALVDRLARLESDA